MEKGGAPADAAACSMPESFEAELAEWIPAGKELRVQVRLNLKPEETLTLHYRHLDQTEGMFHETAFENLNGVYEATVPADYISEEFDLMVYISRISEEKGCRIFPGIYHDKFPYPYHIIEVKEK